MLKIHDRLRLLGTLGTNKLMAGEVSRLLRRALTREESEALLAVPPKKVGTVGISLPFSPKVAALLSTYHRTSARVLWDLYESDAERLEPLYEDIYDGVSRDRRGWLTKNAKISVLAFEPRSVAAGERQIVGVVKNALIDGALAQGCVLTVDGERPDLVFHVRSHEEEEGKLVLTVSLDLAGRPMHQRGYRTQSGDAPLREDLSAALVLFGRHNPRDEAVVDPLAGSGTLLVEAAHLAAARPVWTSGRSAMFSQHPEYGSSYTDLGRPLFADTRAVLYGAEKDPGTFAFLERTLATAGVRPQAKLFDGRFQDWAPSQIIEEAKGAGRNGIFIVSNPPYGARLDGTPSELRRLYRDLGDWCSAFQGSRAAFIVGEPPDSPVPGTIGLFLDSFGHRPRIKKPMRNGPLRAMFLLYDL